MAFLLACAALPAAAATEQELLAAGKAATLRGDSEAAVATFEKLVAMKPNVAEYHYRLGLAYGPQVEAASVFKKMGFAKKIVGSMERAVELDPNYPDPRFALIDFALVAPGMFGGGEDKAILHANELKKRNPLDGHRAFARIYEHQKKRDLARKEYVDAVREQPTSAKAHYFLGRFLLSSDKNYASALHEFDYALKLDPDYMPTYLRIGQLAASSASNYDRGEESLRKYLSYTPKDNEPTHADAWYWLGMIQEKQGKKADARKSYVEAQKITPAAKNISEALKRVS